MIICTKFPPYLDVDPFAENEESDLAIKTAVRERDGYACRDCGMTSEEHASIRGQELHVHRLVPGLVYADNVCVTLCEACHGKKPKRTKDAFWAKDIVWFGFNMYDPAERSAMDLFIHLAKSTGRLPSDVLWEAVRSFIDGTGVELSLQSAQL